MQCVIFRAPNSSRTTHCTGATTACTVVHTQHVQGTNRSVLPSPDVLNTAKVLREKWQLFASLLFTVLVWLGLDLGYFANNASTLPFFLCISMFTCCLRPCVLISEGPHSMTQLPLSQLQIFLRIPRGAEDCNAYHIYGFGSYTNCSFVLFSFIPVKVMKVMKVFVRKCFLFHLW